MKKLSTLTTLISACFAFGGIVMHANVLAGPLGALANSAKDAGKNAAIAAVKDAAGKALQPSQASVQGISGAQLLAGLQDKAQQQNFLYVLGIADASVNKSWCPPAYFDSHQMQQTLIAYMDAQPDARLAGSAIPLVLAGMQERFACKEEGQAAQDLPKMPRQGEFDGSWLYLTVQEAQAIMQSGKQDTQFAAYLHGVQDATQNIAWCGTNQLAQASLLQQLAKVAPAKPETLPNLIATHVGSALAQAHPCPAKTK